MSLTVVSKNEGSRINHPEFKDVHNVTFEIDTIEDFELGDDHRLTDMCKVGGGWLPVFYHCKRHCYEADTADLRSNEALKGGSMAFEVGMDVKVLLESGRPKYVIAHGEQHDPPYMCVDVIRMYYMDWVTGSWYTQYYLGDTESEFSGEDYYGNVPDCSVPEIILFGQREFQTGTIQNYWSDRFIKVGPVFYIIRIESVGLPAPLTKPFSVAKAVWTQELEDECVDIGSRAEESIGGAFSPMPIWPVYPDEVISLSRFSVILDNRFGGMITPAPRWVLTQFRGQSFE
jgi:hypothetical protein